MKTNNLFSIQRFIMLFRQSVIVNKKLMGISLAGVTGTMFAVLIFIQSMSYPPYWNVHNYMGVFFLFFFPLGIIYTSLSFPAFRSKEKSIGFLMLPASTSEKFIFALLTRVVAFILFMPLLFWAVANIEGSLFHHFDPRLYNYKFSFSQSIEELNMAMVRDFGWIVIGQICLFVFIAAFAGASHFSKSPLVKTIFTFSLIVAGFLLFTYLIIKGLNLREYDIRENSGHLIDSKEEVKVFFEIATTAVNLSLLFITWFSLKEKEV